MVRIAGVALLLLACGGPSGGSSSLCERIPEIRMLPFKGEQVDDVVYNAFLQEGERALPCLIEKLIDTTRMPDPRQAPTYANVTVGDVAFFLLADLTNVEFETMLPEAVRDAYRTQGVYAYFEHVEELENRKALQARWREWLRKKEEAAGRDR